MSSNGSRHVRAAARAAGVADRFIDAYGRERIVADETLHAVLHALNDDQAEREAADEDAPPRVIVAWAGSRSIRVPSANIGRGSATLALEEPGESEAVAERPCAVTAIRETGRASRLDLSGALPIGTHRLLLERRGGRRECFVLAAPRSLSRGITNAGRRLAVFLPLHAVRSEASFGVGTLSDLGELVEWAHACGASVVGTLPLFPTFLDAPFDPSPYAPITRLRWGELYVDPRRAPEWTSPRVRRRVSGRGFLREVAAAHAREWVEYRRTWSLLMSVLSVMVEEARSSPARWKEVLHAAGGCLAYAGARGSALAELRAYAAFRAAVDEAGDSWGGWSAERRTACVARVGEEDHRAATYIYAQALANQQMAAVSRHADGSRPLYLDLPVGVHPDGFDVWRRPELFVKGLSAGAPPDMLFTGGQVWGFPPMHPAAARVDGYAYLRSVLRRMLSVAGVLRIDHVMGLLRMYCVPSGFDGTQGAYLAYPAEELFAIVMIEAARAGALVVGEDLGTVPPKIREMMSARGILGMHVQQFSLSSRRKSISLPKADRPQLASLNTHDTPTFAGYWSGDDIEFRARTGVLSPRDAWQETKERAAVRRAVTAACAKKGARVRTAREAGTELMAMQARTGAPITLVNLEDLWEERRPQNIPGLAREYPNWRRRAAVSLSGITRSAEFEGVLRRLSALRARPRRVRAAPARIKGGAT